MRKMFVRTGDTVEVISGKSKGVRGEVIAVSPKENKVIVKGAQVVTKHVKPHRMGEQGGIVEVESAMYASKVQLVCPKCGKAVRVGHKDGKRVCKNKDCGHEF